MNYNEFKTILKNEKLNNICFDENNLSCNTVYLVKKDNDFLVYTTDERAVVFGKVKTFQTYMNSIKSDFGSVPVKNYSATTLLDNAFGYSTKQDYPTPFARIESVTKTRPVETVVADMNKTSTQKFEAAEIKKDGKIERKFDFEKEIIQTIKPIVHYPVQPQKPTEADRMAKINANYEHDKRVLAKKDPMFAKNKMWDVGHAEESGELTDREMRKMAALEKKEMHDEVKGE